jgi:hypothetical protein
LAGEFGGRVGIAGDEGSFVVARREVGKDLGEVEAVVAGEGGTDEADQIGSVEILPILKCASAGILRCVTDDREGFEAVTAQKAVGLSDEDSAG